MTKEKLEKVRKVVRDKAVNDTKLNKQQVKDLETIFKEAKQPVKFLNKDFELGEGELDIRALSSVNMEQMTFRMLCNLLTYLRQMNQNLVDLEKLVMISLKKQGVESIIKETEDLEKDLKNELNQNKA